MSTKRLWHGYAVVRTSGRNAARLQARLDAMAEYHRSNGLDIQFTVEPVMVLRDAGLKGAGVLLSFVAKNSDPNRVPVDVDRKIRAAMGDATCGVELLIERA